MGIAIPAGEGDKAGVRQGRCKLRREQEDRSDPTGPPPPALRQPADPVGLSSHLRPSHQDKGPLCPGLISAHCWTRPRETASCPKHRAQCTKDNHTPVRCQVPLWPGPRPNLPGRALPPPAFTTPCEDTLPPFLTCQARLIGEGHSRMTF